jgi:hypothetical protein
MSGAGFSLELGLPAAVSSQNGRYTVETIRYRGFERRRSSGVPPDSDFRTSRSAISRLPLNASSWCRVAPSALRA